MFQCCNCYGISANIWSNSRFQFCHRCFGKFERRFVELVITCKAEDIDDKDQLDTENTGVVDTEPPFPLVDK
jgi:hypothetical protein